MFPLVPPPRHRHPSNLLTTLDMNPYSFIILLHSFPNPPHSVSLQHPLIVNTFLHLLLVLSSHIPTGLLSLSCFTVYCCLSFLLSQRICRHLYASPFISIHPCFASVLPPHKGLCLCLYAVVPSEGRRMQTEMCWTIQPASF